MNRLESNIQRERERERERESRGEGERLCEREKGRRKVNRYAHNLFLFTVLRALRAVRKKTFHFIRNTNIYDYLAVLNSRDLRLLIRLWQNLE